VAASETVLALAFIGAVCLNFAEVLGRYVFGHSLMGADEVQVYIMIAMTFLGAAVVAWRDTHLRMDVLALKLPAGVRRILRAAELALVATLSGLALVYSSRYVALMHAVDERSNNAGIPLWLVHSLVAAGFAALLIVSLVRGTQLARSWRSAGVQHAAEGERDGS
jgi:TRAP-type C4-dicarboxylate transport system permease small subunit